MQRYLKSLLLTSTAIFAFSVQSFGQLTTTFNTVDSYAGGSFTSISSGRAMIQTFTSASHLDSVTYRFSTSSSANSFVGSTINAYFAQWDPVNNKVVGPQLTVNNANNTSASTITVSSTDFVSNTDPAHIFTDTNSNTYRGFDFQFNLNATLQSDLTYAMILVGVSGSAIGLLNVDQVDAFVYGDGGKRNSGINTNPTTGFANLGVTGTGLSTFNSIGGDWGFSAISITIVPEPSTAAAALVAGFLGVMVIRRRLQQRTKVQPVTVA